MKRVIWIVLDSVGIGYMPDYKFTMTKISNTLKNICKREKINLKNLQYLGIGNIDGVDCIEKNEAHDSAVMRAGFKKYRKRHNNGALGNGGSKTKRAF
jgi:phosphopentomutase